MNSLLSQRLLADFPSLYADPDDSQQVGFAWGFQCGSGWFPLLYELSQQVMRLSPDTRVFCVKEKFGLLRFYTHGAIDTIRDAIDAAVDLSEVTCERCGEPGTEVTHNGWVTTRCSSCHACAAEKFDQAFDDRVAQQMLRRLDHDEGKQL